MRGLGAWRRVRSLTLLPHLLRDIDAVPGRRMRADTAVLWKFVVIKERGRARIYTQRRIETPIASRPKIERIEDAGDRRAGTQVQTNCRLPLGPGSQPGLRRACVREASDLLL